METNTVDLVPVTKFFALPPEHQAAHKSMVVAALMAHSDWHRTIAQLLPKNGIKLSCTQTESGSLVGVHVCLFNDFKLVKLGRDYGFPRGFCLVVDAESNRLVGQGTFYPKFANDDRNVGFSSKDFGNVEKISCFLKYSGSTGIVTILYDEAGQAFGWTGSSKNSCNHGDRGGGIVFAAEISRVFSRHATREFLRLCSLHRITSIGMEVFLAADQVHGYGYHDDGIMVTSMTKESASGQPRYLAPTELHELCQESGLPTDKPIVVEGTAAVQSFVSSIAACRDVLTLPLLHRVLAQQGIELVTQHEKLVDSDIIEGFVIRRWKSGVEMESVKFKIWLYQLVTQVLRPWLSTGTKGLDGEKQDRPIRSLKDIGGQPNDALITKARGEMKKWCTDPSPEMQKLCLWLIRTAARASLPPNLPSAEVAPPGCVPRSALRAYWVLLGEHAVRELSKLFVEANWDPHVAASLSVGREAALHDGPGEELQLPVLDALPDPDSGKD